MTDIVRQFDNCRIKAATYSACLAVEVEARAPLILISRYISYVVINNTRVVCMMFRKERCALGSPKNLGNYRCTWCSEFFGVFVGTKLLQLNSRYLQHRITSPF